MTTAAGKKKRAPAKRVITKKAKNGGGATAAATPSCDLRDLFLFASFIVAARDEAPGEMLLEAAAAKAEEYK